MDTSLKPLLTTYAYNILGTLQDAEDIVQDAFLKFHSIDKTAINDEKAYLTRMVINLSINLKKKMQKTVSDYFGEWLPEPVSTETPDASIEKKDILSYSMMVLLERLNPKQRAVFILKEAFDYEHEEIAAVLAITPDNSRQLLNRAKKLLQKETPPADSKINAENLNKYIDIIRSGDINRIEQLLNKDINVISDGGGKAVAFVNPVSGVRRVAALLNGIQKKYYSDVRISKTEINHQPAIFYYDGNDQLITCQILIFENDVLTKVFFIRNPDKLKSL
jgi:RNA polymerase sigma factor (sigma-70 family)